MSSFFEDLTPDEKELLASLPYRVGVWMSECDDSGGDDSDEQEKRVLENIIEGYAREVFGSELTQYVMTETVMGKEHWQRWSEQDFSKIPGDCEMALEILSRYGEDNDVMAFAHHLVEIAEAVAMAFSEYQNNNIFTKFTMSLQYSKQVRESKKKGERAKSKHEFLSISPAERAVLIEISDALGLDDYI
ncbi:MAG: hypothetical protein AAF182_03465 [Pseudomonadota bacterium]